MSSVRGSVLREWPLLSVDTIVVAPDIPCPYSTGMDDALTVKELAARAAPGAGPDEIQQIIHQLRHWTASHVLLPSTEIHTGPGSHRKYSADAVYNAAVLLELAALNLPVGILLVASAILPRVITWPTNPLGKDVARKWAEAISGKRRVFFRFSTAMGKAQIRNMGLIYAGDEILIEGMIGAIVLDLTKLFSRLRV